MTLVPRPPEGRLATEVYNCNPRVSPTSPSGTGLTCGITKHITSASFEFERKEERLTHFNRSDISHRICRRDLKAVPRQGNTRNLGTDGEVETKFLLDAERYSLRSNYVGTGDLYNKVWSTITSVSRLS
jgi:hypothetical protein